MKMHAIKREAAYAIFYWAAARFTPSKTTQTHPFEALGNLLESKIAANPKFIDFEAVFRVLIWL
jgi:hypothetical protein